MVIFYMPLADMNIIKILVKVFKTICRKMYLRMIKNIVLEKNFISINYIYFKY